ncbi:MAG: magnesium chelatase subunit H [Pseudomonadota bacterium]
MPKRTSDVNEMTPVKVIIITMDNHLTSAVERANKKLKKELPGVELSLHAAAEWANNPVALGHCLDDIAKADVIIATMLFMEEHIKPVLKALQERQPNCDVLVGAMSAREIMRLTRIGSFVMGAPQSGAIALLKKLSGAKNKNKNASSGAGQMAMLRRIPRILRFIPGKAQDVRAYFLTLQYWLAGSDENVANMVRLLINRYASGPRSDLKDSLKVGDPAEYPDVGIYHPAIKSRITDSIKSLPVKAKNKRGTVGLLVMRSYILAGNTRHYDAVIESFEEKGINVIPVFSSGLDSRPAIKNFFFNNDQCRVDAVVSLTGFSLVGGPAYNNSDAAQEMLAKLDVPYIAAQAVEFQKLEDWQKSEHGLMPVEATMMVAIPEIDGATGSCVFGGRSEENGDSTDMQPEHDRVDILTRRVEKLISLRKTSRKNRKLACVIFNFPPNAGSTGTAAHLSVYSSLFNTLKKLKQEGYTVNVPNSVDELRDKILHGNAEQYGAQANVHTLISADDHIRRETWLDEIEAQWGAAPGKDLSNGRSLFVLGVEFGNVFVGVQPAFGYEGDPMRLLFEKGFTPTHAFSAFYRYLKEDFAADAVLHFGTHGALEFMPGKQVGLSGDCWPDRLIGDLPNFYYYAANNPSEGAIAKRRSAATLISYLTPSLCQSGLYRGLLDLKESVQRWRTLTPDVASEEKEQLMLLIQTQAVELDMVDADVSWDSNNTDHIIHKLHSDIQELEQTLIPQGLHIIGEAMPVEERKEMLSAMAESMGMKLEEEVITKLIAGGSLKEIIRMTSLDIDKISQATIESLIKTASLLSKDHEADALIHALDGHFVKPVAGGDILHNPDILPTGRNLHGFDPFRMPSKFAVTEGARQADQLLERHQQEGNALPESIALVLWGTDNLKSEGAPIGQALALMGAKPHIDSYGRLSGAELIPLEELGRPRIDVVITTSGIFRDLLPLQTKLLADAAYLAAIADESPEQNFIRKHALAYQQQNDCDMETAALRVFSNADGVYGSNVNHLIDNSCWNDEDELAETYQRRKSFAYTRSGKSTQQVALLESILTTVDLTYQNLESVELGVTTLDHYFDTLGGISRSVKRVQGSEVPVYIGDQTRGKDIVRTLSEQVALETRTRMLNPKWYEGMLDHGYEGVRNIEAHITNTMGWSATTGQVDNWVYEQITETYVLDEAMRERLAELNPTASAKVANRLLEAHERNYWSPDEKMLEALREAGEILEDRLEGIGQEAAA